MYLNDFSCKEDLISAFFPSWAGHKPPEDFDDINILLASYGGGSYDGDAFILCEKKGKLYTVEGSHCSCYGLEGQWGLESTNVDTLLHRVNKGTLGENWSGHRFKKELLQILDELKAKTVEYLEPVQGGSIDKKTGV